MQYLRILHRLPRAARNSFEIFRRRMSRRDSAYFKPQNGFRIQIKISFQSSSDSGRFVHSKVSNLSVTPDRQEKDKTSTSKTSTSSKESKEERCKPNVTPQLQRTCDQCKAIVRACDGHEVNLSFFCI